MDSFHWRYRKYCLLLSIQELNAVKSLSLDPALPVQPIIPTESIVRWPDFISDVSMFQVPPKHDWFSRGGGEGLRSGGFASSGEFVYETLAVKSYRERCAYYKQLQDARLANPKGGLMEVLAKRWADEAEKKVRMEKLKEKFIMRMANNLRSNFTAWAKYAAVCRQRSILAAQRVREKKRRFLKEWKRRAKILKGMHKMNKRQNAALLKRLMKPWQEWSSKEARLKKFILQRLTGPLKTTFYAWKKYAAQVRARRLEAERVSVISTMFGGIDLRAHFRAWRARAQARAMGKRCRAEQEERLIQSVFYGIAANQLKVRSALKKRRHECLKKAFQWRHALCVMREERQRTVYPPLSSFMLAGSAAGALKKRVHQSPLVSKNSLEIISVENNDMESVVVPVLNNSLEIMSAEENITKSKAPLDIESVPVCAEVTVHVNENQARKPTIESSLSLPIISVEDGNIRSQLRPSLSTC